MITLEEFNEKKEKLKLPKLVKLDTEESIDKFLKELDDVEVEEVNILGHTEFFLLDF